MSKNEFKWTGSCNIYRPTTDYSDLIKIVGCYYDMYSRAVAVIAPAIARQQGKTFIPVDRETIKSALGRERPYISFRARTAFIDSLERFMVVTKGKKALITPSPSSHHSAQFPSGSFSIGHAQASDAQSLRKPPGRKSSTTVQRVFEITLTGAETPFWVEDLRCPIEAIRFILIRPKLGKLGTPSATNWEMLYSTSDPGYLVEHVDSDLNPRWAGIL